jgi:hypothetical protein
LPGVLVFVAASEVAVPPASDFAAPTCVPPLEQSPPFAFTVVGSQRKNVMVPLGVPDEPLTVATSVAKVPDETLPPVGLEFVVMVVGWGGRTTLKHSAVLSVCVDPRYVVLPE